jgi:hypothetical protein
MVIIVVLLCITISESLQNIALQRENAELKQKLTIALQRIVELENKIVELNATALPLQEPEKEKLELTKLVPPYYLIVGQHSPVGLGSFFNEFHQIYQYERVIGFLGGYPLVEGVGEDYSDIVKKTSIIILPTSFEAINEYKELEKKYPEIVPISSAKVKAMVMTTEKYDEVLFLYFTKKDGIIRGVIVADTVDSNLAHLLTEKGVVLDAPFKYEKGEIKILKRN